MIHAVSLDNQRRTSAAVIARAIRSAMTRALELGVETLAIPALGTGVGGFPLDGRLPGSRLRPCAPSSAGSRQLASVTFALRGAAAYEAFRVALAAPSETPSIGGAA